MKYLIYGYYGYNNLGDELLLNSIVENITASDISAYFTILNKSTINLKRYDNVKYSNIRDILHNSSNKILKFIHFFKSFKEHIDNSDVFIIGGGTLFMDNGKINFLMAYLSYFVSYASKKNKKVILLGIGIDILSNPFSLLWMKRILSNVNYAYCRDELSFQIAKKISSKNNVNLTQDLLFCNKKITDYFSENFRENHKTIGISLIDYSSKFKKDFVYTINELLKQYIDDGFNIKLLSFQINTDRADNIFYKKLINHKNIEIIELNIDNFVEHFKNIDYILSMRFHGILLGLLFGKKVIGIIHESKNYQLCLDTNIEYVYLEDFSKQNIYNKNFKAIDKLSLDKLIKLSKKNFNFLKEE